MLENSRVKEIVKILRAIETADVAKISKGEQKNAVKYRSIVEAAVSLAESQSDNGSIEAYVTVDHATMVLKEISIMPQSVLGNRIS